MQCWNIDLWLVVISHGSFNQSALFQHSWTNLTKIVYYTKCTFVYLVMFDSIWLDDIWTSLDFPIMRHYDDHWAARQKPFEEKDSSDSGHLGIAPCISKSQTYFYMTNAHLTNGCVTFTCLGR